MLPTGGQTPGSLLRGWFLFLGHFKVIGAGCIVFFMLYGCFIVSSLSFVCIILLFFWTICVCNIVLISQLLSFLYPSTTHEPTTLAYKGKLKLETSKNTLSLHNICTVYYNTSANVKQTHLNAHVH